MRDLFVIGAGAVLMALANAPLDFLPAEHVELAPVVAVVSLYIYREIRKRLGGEPVD